MIFSHTIPRRAYAAHHLFNGAAFDGYELVKLGPNKFIDVVWGTPDFDRLIGCFDHIARGLHFHEFGERFSGVTKPLIGYTRDTEENPREFKRFIKDKVASELSGKRRLGANPDIFTYQFTDPD